VSNATVNKLLGGVQAVSLWARDNGLMPDDVLWADPFANMRLQEDAPTREPWQLEELRLLFKSAVFTKDVRPTAGRGEAAFWLPLLGLFTGARLGELAPLTVADVAADEPSSKWFGRYIRDLGITNRASVFHSFRHGFKDALRAAEVSEDVNDALTGHAGPGNIGRQYGAKQMIRRFGIATLAAAVSKVAYPGLDLSYLTYQPANDVQF
jgi:integrase